MSARFFSLGRDPWATERMVREGRLPPAALGYQCQRALVEAMTYGSELLEVAAFGNEDRAYAEVCYAELERRRALEEEA